MTEKSQTSPQDPHYLRTVTQLGDSHKIVSNQDIYNQQGLKLVAKGTSINSHLFDKLVHHKLLPQIDQCLSVENSINTQDLKNETLELLKKNPFLQSQIDSLPDCPDILNIIGDIHLNSTLAFKLTIAHKQQPELISHSLLLAIFSIYLGHRYGLDKNSLIQLATASLFHDLGILHIDPALLKPDHVLSDNERRSLYTHPFVIYLILNEFPEYSSSISQAVLEHHERLDGSGYPRGLPGDKISLFGQILAVAEVSASRCDKEGYCHHLRRLEIILKLNTHKLPREIVALLTPFFNDGSNDTVNSINDIPRKLPTVPYSLAELFLDWEQFTGTRGNFVIQQEYQELFNFINSQLSNLLKELHDAGFDPHNLEQLMQDAEDDPKYLDDLLVLTHEAHWQILGQINEAIRRWPDLISKPATGQAGHLLDWIQKVQSLSEPQGLGLDTDFDEPTELDEEL
jgi:HD-GYP domain-containing protein (c-di-GMP phosphodiesterase class II)